MISGPAALTSLIASAISQSNDLVQAEFRLARAEISEKLAATRSGLAFMAIAAVLLIASLGLLLQALASLLIANGVSPPLATVIVGGAIALLGIALFLIGQRRLSPRQLAPKRTLRSLAQDKRVVEDAVT
jgi:uncharacterized membrane protein YqjE